MTKERKLAIQMWTEIKALLPLWYNTDRFNIGNKVCTFKYNFCSNKKVNWLYNCWLCQYSRLPRNDYSCARCPLKSCGGDGPWQIIMRYRYSLKAKLAACDAIITALKGRK